MWQQQQHPVELRNDCRAHHRDTNHRRTRAHDCRSHHTGAHHGGTNHNRKRG